MNDTVALSKKWESFHILRKRGIYPIVDRPRLFYPEITPEGYKVSPTVQTFLFTGMVIRDIVFFLLSEGNDVTFHPYSTLPFFCYRFRVTSFPPKSGTSRDDSNNLVSLCGNTVVRQS